jgi:hypothetical protein
VGLLLPWPKDVPQNFTAETVKKCGDFAAWTVNFKVPRTHTLQKEKKKKNTCSSYAFSH